MRASTRTIVPLLLALGMSQQTSATPAPREVKAHVEVVVNPVVGLPRTACEVAAGTQAKKPEWWASFGQARPDPEGGWQATESDARCGGGSIDRESSAGHGAPYLRARISTVAGFLPPTPSPDRALVLEISLALEKLSGFDAGGAPAYQRSEARRHLYFLDRRDALVPLLVLDPAETRAFGVREVLLRVSVLPARDDPTAVYGVLSVASGTRAGQLLLDGAAVGATSGGDTVLRHVPAGVHEVGIRDPSGRELRKAVRVVANRTVRVELGLPAPARDADLHRLVPLGVNPQGHREYRRGSDAAVVVRIPAGDFLMGNQETERTPLEHRVYVSEFLIDKLPVSWGQLKSFVAATGMPLPPHEPYWGVHDDHPAVYVTWEEAKAYCEWAGGRLPTEAEREKAARGTDARKYPWGDEEPDPRRAVFRHEWGHAATEPVGTHPAGASPYGLLDMAGNVWEWCSDWHDDGYYAVSPASDPKGPASGVAHVVRGGSWDSRPSVLSCSCRNWGHRGYREGDFGFRCAMNAP